MVPSGAFLLTEAGHTVLVEKGAGMGSGITDDEYLAAGCQIIENASDVWAGAEIVVKVKEPLAEEYQYLRSDLVVFTYFHFAASKDLTDACLDSGVAAVAYETLGYGDAVCNLCTGSSQAVGTLCHLK